MLGSESLLYSDDIVKNRCAHLSDIIDQLPLQMFCLKFLKIFCSTDVKNIYLLLIINLALDQAVLQISVYMPYGNTLTFVSLKNNHVCFGR